MRWALPIKRKNEAWKMQPPLYLEVCIEEQKIHNRIKATGTKILEELIFLILVAEYNFQTHDKYLKGVWALGNKAGLHTLLHKFYSASSQLCPLICISCPNHKSQFFFAQHLLFSMFLGVTKSIRLLDKAFHLDNSHTCFIAIIRAVQRIFSTSRVVQAMALEKIPAKLKIPKLFETHWCV